MNLKPRDLRALVFLALGVIAVLIFRATNSPSVVSSSAETPALLEARLRKLRQVAASVPGKVHVLSALQAQVAQREKSMLQFTTAPQAQAHLLEVARRVGSANRIEARGGDFSAPRALGEDYGEVTVGVSFECAIDQFMNFLADLSREPEAISPAEVRLAAGNVKNKTINVRLLLSGVVSRKLVPEKKGPSLL